MVATRAPCPMEETFLRSKRVTSTISERSVTTTRASSDDSESWRTDSDTELDSPSSKCQSEASPQQRRRKVGGNADIMKLFQTGAEALMRAKALNAGTAVPVKPKDAVPKRQPKKQSGPPSEGSSGDATTAPSTPQKENVPETPKASSSSKHMAEPAAASPPRKFRCDAEPFVPSASSGNGISAVRQVAQRVFGDNMVSFTDVPADASTAIYITVCSTSSQVDAAHALLVALGMEGPCFRVRSPASDYAWINVDYMGAGVARQCPEFLKHGWCPQPGCKHEHRRPEAVSVAVSVVGAQAGYSTQLMGAPMMPMPSQPEVPLQWVPVPVPVPTLPMPAPALPSPPVFASTFPIQMPMPFVAGGSWGVPMQEASPVLASTPKPILSLAPLCQEPAAMASTAHPGNRHRAAPHNPVAPPRRPQADQCELVSAAGLTAGIERAAPSAAARSDSSEQSTAATASQPSAAPAETPAPAEAASLAVEERPAAAPVARAVRRSARWADMQDDD